jgi:ribonuclease PH
MSAPTITAEFDAEDGVTTATAVIDNGSFGSRSVTFETGRLARQAAGSVVVTMGDTMLLSATTAGRQPKEQFDFFPLTVDVEERMYAAGKIPGSFFRREGRAGEKATLTARMIDRPLRPLFPKGWNRETQLVSIPMSIDHEHPYDILAMNGASAALMVSDIPFPAPVGAVRIGQDAEGNFLVNPDEEWLLESPLDLVVAGTEEAILMVEAGANEVPEAEILDALDIAHSEIRKLCAAQRELAEKAGKPKLEVDVPKPDEDLLRQIAESHGAALDAATQVEDKLLRQEATKGLQTLADWFKDGHIPKAAITWTEEEGRKAFQDGELIFHRNWPYVYAFAAKTDGSSKVNGKFDAAPLPGITQPGVSSLGGSNLGIAKNAENKGTAADFLKFMGSAESQKSDTLATANAPSLEALYSDPDILKKFPYTPTLLESIRTLVDTLPGETAVYPGHMGTTTLGAERATNPFLAELAK